ncbi:MAG: geranylgeranylglyceryl phosphate synthase-like protein [Candidatus Latescibacteria bacterium ADurb.Bin168]|nr:MAG: geranylgeranylglyceryl phosphate synthase-like protein [Candidatus Latescibacteria bacterium ADurb.Bin168]
MLVNAFDRIMATRKTRGAGFWVLIDPDRTAPAEAAARAADAERAGADVILVGSSLLISDTFGDAVREIRSAVKLPVIIFPGSTAQISADADAILFLSLVSGRNPDLLIGQHVRAAPAIKAIGLEPIPTAYMLVESGTLTTIEYISDTKPIPRQKPDIAMAHALAAEYMGMKLVYLDGGSGAKEPVPTEMIRACYEYITLPLIVGGGIRSGDAARAAVHAGASFVVVGNALEKTSGRSLLTELADAVHSAAPA